MSDKEILRNQRRPLDIIRYAEGVPIIVCSTISDIAGTRLAGRDMGSQNLAKNSKKFLERLPGIRNRPYSLTGRHSTRQGQ